MFFKTEIISTKAYILNKVLGKLCFFLLVMFSTLVIDRELEGGLLSLIKVSKSIKILVWILIIITLTLSIYLSTIKYNLGKIVINENEIFIKLNTSKIYFEYKYIDNISITLNRKRNKKKYARGVFDGWRNWIIIYSRNINYKYEISLGSIKKEESFLRIMENISGKLPR